MAVSMPQTLPNHPETNQKQFQPVKVLRIKKFGVALRDPPQVVFVDQTVFRGPQGLQF
jgi:hypothetical protein